MSRICSVCSQAAVATVNDLLRSGRSARSVAIEFGLGEDSMERHRRHLPPEQPSNPPADGPDDPLDEMVEALRPRMLDGHPGLAREYRLALADRAAAGRSSAPPVDLATTTEWSRLRDAMLAALKPYPAARQAIADVISGWE